MADAGRELGQLKQAHKQAEEAFKARTADLDEVNALLTALGDQMARANLEISQAERDSRAAIDQASRAHANLAEDYQARIASEAPRDAGAWVATTYPTEEDLASVRREASSRPVHQARLKQIRSQFGEWQKLDVQLKSIKEHLAGLRETCPVEKAKRAREESGKLATRQTTLGSELADRQADYDAALRAAKSASDATKRIGKRIADLGSSLAAARATRDQIELARETSLRDLSEGWKQLATNASRADIADWKAERDDLAHYETEAEDLEQASQSQEHLESEIGSLEAKIEELPTEARRPVKAVDKDLETAGSLRDAADDRRREADGNRSELGSQRSRRSELEEKRRHADRQQHLHYLLGPNNLQHHLLSHAEGEIVRLANEVLDGLSGGNMRLELRSSANAGTALDLLVYNLETGQKPIAVALASGSQRFRIAVSLALAIGSYAGSEARQMEAVIIDEGFGSLDKVGRNDMIQELNDLKEQLKRIILVSHQEEFTDAFVNGYRIELIDGASRVSMLDQP